MKVQHILQDKGTQVHSISPEASLAEVVQELVAKNCGSLLVMEGERPVGIITERDILRACANDTRSLDRIPVHEKMTRDLVVGGPCDDVNQIMGLLTARRIRHLPIVENGRLAGLISIGDVVKAQYERLSLENQYLKEYLQG